MTSVAELKRRAVTDAQKEFRRKEILDGARSYFEDVGYEGFAMNQLASRLGIVKGTLYLYFPTREAIILALYGSALEAWCETLKQRLATPLAGNDFITFFYRSALADPVLVPILTRLEHVIEHHVSVELLVASKRHFIACLEGVTDKAEGALGLGRDAARQFILSLGVLLSGATQADQGPALAREDLPEDVREFLDGLSSEKIFTQNARHILAGMRREART